jgi:predicted phosphate transport protein (TIGR00153 family)
MTTSTKSNTTFYQAFEQQAACVVEAAQLLSTMFGEIGTSAAVNGRIRDLEHQGDQITHDTMARLHKTWITPLDSLDIRSLVSALDDVLDLTEAISDRVVLFRIASTAEGAQALANVLLQSCEAVASAIRLLPTLKRSDEILELCQEINRLESEADRAYRKAMAALYHNGSASNQLLEIMKWRDIYDNLEAATDRCEDIANILEGVVLEYS